MRSITDDINKEATARAEVGATPEEVTLDREEMAKLRAGTAKLLIGVLSRGSSEPINSL